METYFEGFHDEEEQISGNEYLPVVDEVIKDQLGVLESIKEDDRMASREESFKNQYSIGNEDFHQIMSDWQQHVGLLQSIDTEDLGLGLGLGLDVNGDGLNMCSDSLFEEKESPILSKVLKSPVHKNVVNDDSTSMLFGTGSDSKKEELSPYKCVQGCRKLCEFIKNEAGLLGRVTVLNGEKEILEKNIIGLHCLNEIRESPYENCQVTSTVINGKRYKIIIKPKSLKMKKFTNDKIKKTLIKRLLQCNAPPPPKTEPKEDEIISEMRNGNYDVPILGSDLLPSWDLVNLDPEWTLQLGNDGLDAGPEERTDTETTKKIPPLRIKIPKLGKKTRRKVSPNKSEEEVDVETVGDKAADPVAQVRVLKADNAPSGRKTGNQQRDKSSEGFPMRATDKIDPVQRKRDCRIPLIQAMPSKKAGKCSTRMQDAVATMNRNKLLKIVSGGDTISLDHDYCTTLNKSATSCQQTGKKSRQLNEKNPKKDSGMESGDVSDASEEARTPDTPQNLQPNNASNRLSERVEKGTTGQRQESAGSVVSGDPFFRSTKSAEVNVSNGNAASDSVKTQTVSSGNKALTNDVCHTSSSSDNSQNDNVNNSSCVTVPSEKLTGKKEDVVDGISKPDLPKETNGQSLSEQCQPERPKRKLKLEEYLSRRNIREKEKEKEKESSSGPVDVTPVGETVSEVIVVSPSETETKSDPANSSKNKTAERESNKDKRDKKYWRGRSRRSSSASSSGEKRISRRGRRSRSRSRSRSRWRRSGSSSSNNGKRHEERGKRSRSRWSAGRERRINFWSGSSSRSLSRESSTSSDYGSSKHSRNSSRYDRRSRSRSRNRNHSSRSRLGGYHYTNRRNSARKRSRSPYYAYSMREKQRQIEERRVIYVGRIEEGMTSAKLRKRFSIFGPIVDISLHFREYGDNYGFVTYAYKSDAYDAVEHGNDDPSQPRYDLCFGGRRGFCKEKYADLDGMPTSYSGFNDASILRSAKDSFDLLLKEAQAKLKNRKKQ